MSTFGYECANYLAKLGRVEKGTYNLALAAEIRAERAARGLTQQQLADASGINYETLKHVLKGDRDINVTQIVQLAAVFEISPQKLVERAMARAERLSPREMDAAEI